MPLMARIALVDHLALVDLLALVDFMTLVALMALVAHLRPSLLVSVLCCPPRQFSGVDSTPEIGDMFKSHQ